MSAGNMNPSSLPSGLLITDSIGTIGQSAFTTSHAFTGEFLGLPIPDDEQLWGLSPISPIMGTGGWDAKADAAAFASSALERDLKNTQVRNGQPTPPPYDDHSLRDSSSLEIESASKRRATRESKTAAASLSPDLDENPHQERAKRAKFLERNRLAAKQSEKKEHLVAEITRLRSEILSLKNEVLKHAQCGDEPIKLHLAQMVKKITDIDGPPPPPTMAGPPADLVENVSTSPSEIASAATTTTAPTVPAPLSFGFDDSLQLEPAAAAAAAEAFEQQLRRDSEATLVSESSYAFSADNTFDDLINV
ncbi:Rho GTPase activation protein [Penicillium macrosclerotiorum]|uniref:Rho GTPase activation protein n=1 Tax=Penicillium macrosclerotiorum TaxID=303699 RepID=UPI002549783F|nr:Rho GTPase activation protein [Penicillium macrosclerotiorum]KAJ5690100.1 Rho GTPase activation protein [Penicillium macrosclerotiorum]